MKPAVGDGARGECESGFLRGRLFVCVCEIDELGVSTDAEMPDFKRRVAFYKLGVNEPFARGLIAWMLALFASMTVASAVRRPSHLCRCCGNGVEFVFLNTKGRARNLLQLPEQDSVIPSTRLAANCRWLVRNHENIQFFQQLFVLFVRETKVSSTMEDSSSNRRNTFPRRPFHI